MSTKPEFTPGESMDTSVSGKIYRINRRPSIFVSRNNATVKNDDVVIQRENRSCRSWGARDKASGKRFVTIAIFAAETGEPIRLYEDIPREITAFIGPMLKESN